MAASEREKKRTSVYYIQTFHLIFTASILKENTLFFLLRTTIKLCSNILNFLNCNPNSGTFWTHQQNTTTVKTTTTSDTKRTERNGRRIEKKLDEMFHLIFSISYHRDVTELTLRDRMQSITIVGVITTQRNCVFFFRVSDRERATKRQRIFKVETKQVKNIKRAVRNENENS